MRVIALDIGDSRVGVAYADTRTNIAVPLKVMPAADVIGFTRPFRLLLEDYEPDLLVSGLPLSLSGEPNEQTQKIEAIARKISQASGIPLDFEDERLSSSEAKRIMHKQGMTEKQMRGKLDSVAASLFLQAWLDSHATTVSED